MNQAPLEMTVEDLNAQLASRKDLFVLDVREPDEWQAGHLAVAKHIPLAQVAAKGAELPSDKHIVVVCRSGGRSGKACELLRQKGFKQVTNLAGGMRAWSEKIDKSMVVI